jgi:ankyrin repeat protein
MSYLYEYLETKGATPLMEAAYNGRISMINNLIDAGMSVNDQDSDGKTALMYMASGCHRLNREIKSSYWISGIKYLIDAGASLDIQDNNGVTALMMSARTVCCKPLIEAGALLDIQADDGFTAISWCNNWKYVEDPYISHFIEAGASLDISDNSGNTLLQKIVNPINAEKIIRGGASFIPDKIPKWRRITENIKYESQLARYDATVYFSSDVLDNILMRYLYSDSILLLPHQGKRHRTQNDVRLITNRLCLAVAIIGILATIVLLIYRGVA